MKGPPVDISDAISPPARVAIIETASSLKKQFLLTNDTGAPPWRTPQGFFFSLNGDTPRARGPIRAESRSRGEAHINYNFV